MNGGKWHMTSFETDVVPSTMNDKWSKLYNKQQT